MSEIISTSSTKVRISRSLRVFIDFHREGRWGDRC